ncbi:MAG: hypothetical protein J6Q22_11140 [Prevotella sp.]|nr:hypothetical protein [Prevotella sp.]
MKPIKEFDAYVALCTLGMVCCMAFLAFAHSTLKKAKTAHTFREQDSAIQNQVHYSIKAEILKQLSTLKTQIVSTNLVRIPCTCGVCKPDQGIVVPEHVNSIGHDLKVEVSTSYYPIVSLPARKP